MSTSRTHESKALFAHWPVNCGVRHERLIAAVEGPRSMSMAWSRSTVPLASVAEVKLPMTTIRRPRVHLGSPGPSAPGGPLTVPSAHANGEPGQHLAADWVQCGEAVMGDAAGQGEQTPDVEGPRWSALPRWSRR